VGVSPVGMLSVVVAVHGVEEYLAECLDSILDRRTPGRPTDDLDVVAVNDASPDGCARILDTYAAGDPRLRVVHVRHNVGLGFARNIGLIQATGEYVWFVDGDDRLAPGAVAAVVERLVAAKPDVLLLGHAMLDGAVSPGGAAWAGWPGGARSGGAGRSGGDARLAALAEPVALRERPDLIGIRQAAWNRVVRRAFLDEVGLRFPSGWYEDVGFSHLALARAGRIAGLDRVCYLYRRRGSGAITATPSERHFDVFEQYEELFAELRRSPGFDGLHARVFAQMVEHYLVIVGTEGRVPSGLRAAFFARMAQHYRRFLPAGGYPVPRGLNGVKHRFVRWDAYGMYATARGLYRARRGPRWAVPALDGAETTQAGPGG
jgi:glycosyltransferase involved in cell wall biosynthesis